MAIFSTWLSIGSPFCFTLNFPFENLSCSRHNYHTIIPQASHGCCWFACCCGQDGNFHPDVHGCWPQTPCLNIITTAWYSFERLFLRFFLFLFLFHYRFCVLGACPLTLFFFVLFVSIWSVNSAHTYKAFLIRYSSSPAPGFFFFGPLYENSMIWLTSN